MSRYGYKAYVDPRASVYHDEDMDFSRGSFVTRAGAIAIKESSDYSHPSSPHHHPQSPRRVPPLDLPSSATVLSDSLGGSYPESRSNTVSSDFRGSYQEDRSRTEEDVTGEVTPPKATASVSAYIPWTGGVQYSNPENAIVEPISTEELLEGLSGMKLQREKRKVEVGTGPRGIPGSGFNHDNGYGSRAGGIGRPANQGYCNRAVQSSGGNDDPWGSGGGNDDDWGVRGAGGGVGGGQARGNECYNCGELGHLSANCIQERKPRGGGGGGACYKCGEEGHISRECVNAPTSGGRDCYNCGQPGHEARDCQNDRVVGAFRGECHNCGEQGHASRDCANERNAGAFRGTCHNCGEEGHQSRDCRKPRNPGGRYEDRNDGRGPAGYTDQGDAWGAPLGTPNTPGFVRSSGDDGGWGREHIVTPTAPIMHRGRSMDRQADEWGSPAPLANNHMNQPPHHIQTRRDDDGWSRPGPHVAENHSVKQEPTPIPAGPGPGIHPDRLRMLNQRGVAIGGYNTRQEPSRDSPSHMDRGGDGYGGGGGYSNGSPSIPFSAPPQHMRQDPPVPQQSRASEEYDGW